MLPDAETIDNPSKIRAQTKASSSTLTVTFMCVVSIGLALIPLFPVKLNPLRTLSGFTVQSNMPSTSTRMVEIEATNKLEAMLTHIKGIENVYSTSDNSSGSITIKLGKYADIDAVHFETSTIIRRTWPQLPGGVNYLYIRMKRLGDNASRPFISLTLNASPTPILIQQYADEHIKTRLAQTQGIYRIDSNGATPMEWVLEYDSGQLRWLGVPLNNIQQVAAHYYQEEFLGTYNIRSAPGGKKWIRLALMPEYKEEEFDASRIRVKNVEGKLISLNELVMVSHMGEAPQNYYRTNGLNSVYLSITAEETASQL